MNMNTDARTRREEYVSFTNHMPCVFHAKLVRDKDCFCRANWHDNLEIQICLEGNGYTLIDGKEYPVSTDDIIVVNSNVIHTVASRTHAVFSCLIIDSDFCKAAGIDHTQLTFEQIFQDTTIKNCLHDICSIYGQTDILCQSAKLQIAILQILIELRQKHTVTNRPKSLSTQAFENVKKAIEYLKENYNQKVTLDFLAQEVLSNKYSLSKNFKYVTNQTIVQYLNTYRCEKAKELIMKDVPVNEAARMCGFNDMSFFSRLFKQYIGTLPSYYKNQSKND